MKGDLAPFLERLLERSDLSDGEQEIILNLATQTRHFRTHQEVLRLADKPDSVTIVLDGIIGKYDQTSSGDRQITAMHIAGDAADLQSVTQSKAPYGLVALCNVSATQVSLTALRQAATAHPAIALVFWRDNAVDASITSKWLANVGRSNALMGLAHLLCELTVRYRVPSIEGILTFDLPLTQASLGDALGLTAVHVNRTLRQYSLMGIANFKSGTVKIMSWKQLTRLGGFNPQYLDLPAGRHWIK